MFESGFALLAAHPTDGGATITINGDAFEALFLYQRESVDNGEKFAYIVRAQHWTIVKNLLSCAEIDAAIFHRAGIFGTSGIDHHRSKTNLFQYIGRGHKNGTFFWGVWREGSKRMMKFACCTLRLIFLHLLTDVLLWSFLKGLFGSIA